MNKTDILKANEIIEAIDQLSVLLTTEHMFLQAPNNKKNSFIKAIIEGVIKQKKEDLEAMDVMYE